MTTKDNKFSDFELGMKVTHVTNPNFTMVIYRFNEPLNTIYCGWMTTKGKHKTGSFAPCELLKKI